MNLKYHHLSLLLVLFVMGTGCMPDDLDSDAHVMEKFRERIADLTRNLERDCNGDVLEEAMRRADSLLLDRAKRIRRIEGRPPRPGRPGAPPVKELSSPLPLRPLFPFEIRFDTLLRDSLLLDSLHLDSIDRGLLPEVEIDLEDEN
ncbi:hypothetical protein FUA23_11715 [Neolewinella aurantiaca]|uniref:Uncharacterized protein n=1 Tax=Neolewinella aurantiaca TaxID=2602767 RepID=A0A5C7FEH4_9BACT|nr:hypothetical protein [Neolewinella aurantiaca]TXF89171.1 hypothetical protein FUA23_11715 [Neolewinella aurantiaca]